MTIAVGDKLPDVKFKRIGDDGPEELSTADVFGGKKVALFGLPGAFTPPCTNKHLPGFLDKAAEFRAKGIDNIVCVAVNDMHVLNAWAEATAAKGDILFLPDWNAEFVKAAGLEFDGSAGTLGIRSRRFAMIVDDGVVKALNIEDIPSETEKSSAAALLMAL